MTHGRSAASDGRALDGETVFQVGSITKVFTGLLLADMAVRGLVQLDDPAAKYLPAGVRMPQRGRAITLIDLSKHWSGLPSMPDFSLQGRPDPYAAYSEDDLYRFLNATRQRVSLAHRGTPTWASRYSAACSRDTAAWITRRCSVSASSLRSDSAAPRSPSLAGCSAA